MKIYENIEQGSPEWHELRRGIITASTAGELLTPTGKIAANKTTRDLANQLAAERITGRTESIYQTIDMDRGCIEEIFARDLYNKFYTPARQVGFIETELYGAKIGYSPDGVVGNDGLIEIKSRKAKYQIETINAQSVPNEYVAQLQVGLLVSGRKWIDFISYSNGMAMYIHRVYPDLSFFELIIGAITAFEKSVVEIVENYKIRSLGRPMAEYVEHFTGDEINVD